MQPGSGPAACYLLHRLLPKVDLPLVQQATDQDVDERMALGLLQGSVWAAERASRATKTRAVCASSRKDLDDACACHAVLTLMIGASHRGLPCWPSQKIFGSGLSLPSRKLRVLNLLNRIKIGWRESELAEANNQPFSLQQEAENQWPGKKEELLKSFEFKVLCSDKALDFFEQGFQGCLDLFRANGCSEADHPAPFLNVDKALEALPEDGEIPETEDGARKEAEPKIN